MKHWAVILVLTACGDDRPADPADAALAFDGGGPDASLQGMLFGEACTQPAFPEIGVCHDGAGACNDEAGGSVCRPFCHDNGIPQCTARTGLDHITDRGACVCVPP
ncbi:MAG: hypothetical protein ABI867_20615 [Kofleriaceae bacterium]